MTRGIKSLQSSISNLIGGKKEASEKASLPGATDAPVEMGLSRRTSGAGAPPRQSHQLPESAAPYMPPKLNVFELHGLMREVASELEPHDILRLSGTSTRVAKALEMERKQAMQFIGWRESTGQTVRDLADASRFAVSIDDKTFDLREMRDKLGLPEDACDAAMFARLLETIPQLRGSELKHADDQLPAIDLARTIVQVPDKFGVKMTTSELNELAIKACGLVSHVREGTHSQPLHQEVKHQARKALDRTRNAVHQMPGPLFKGAAAIGFGAFGVGDAVGQTVLSQFTDAKTSNRAIGLVRDMALAIGKDKLDDALVGEIAAVLCEAPTKRGKSLSTLYEAVGRVGTTAQVDAVDRALKKAGRLEMVKQHGMA